MSAVLTVDPAQLRAHIRRVGLCEDPAYRGECQRWFQNAGIRMNYYRPDGLTISELEESAWDAGLFSQRPNTPEFIDILDSQFTGFAYQEKHSPKKRVTRKAVDSAERKARAMRLRKFQCPECRQIARGTRLTELVCGICYALGHSIVRLVRVDPLPEEVLQTQTGASAA